jgi:hypothetical protein
MPRLLRRIRYFCFMPNLSLSWCSDEQPLRRGWQWFRDNISPDCIRCMCRIKLTIVRHAVRICLWNYSEFCWSFQLVETLHPLELLLLWVGRKMWRRSTDNFIMSQRFSYSDGELSNVAPFSFLKLAFHTWSGLTWRESTVWWWMIFLDYCSRRYCLKTAPLIKCENTIASCWIRPN